MKRAPLPRIVQQNFISKNRRYTTYEVLVSLYVVVYDRTIYTYVGNQETDDSRDKPTD